MGADAEVIAAIADALVSARRSGDSARASDWNDALGSREDAYRVQAAVAARLDWFPDDTPRAWKTGAPSLSAVPTHAPIPAAGLLASGSCVGTSFGAIVGLEPEIAFRLGRDVSAGDVGSPPDSIAQLVDSMLVTVEVVASRWLEQMEAPPLLLLADQQSHAALVLGTPMAVDVRDWSGQHLSVHVDGRLACERVGTHPTGTPLALLAGWLRHATRAGGIVRAGTLVTTGSWAGILPLPPGASAEVVFDGVGSVRLHR